MYLLTVEMNTVRDENSFLDMELGTHEQSTILPKVFHMETTKTSRTSEFRDQILPAKVIPTQRFPLHS